MDYLNINIMIKSKNKKNLSLISVSFQLKIIENHVHV